jgi:hypothetical protein
VAQIGVIKVAENPTHAQAERLLTPERRALTKRAADLCRRDPAASAAVVRHADQLRAAGVDYDEAFSRALTSQP